MTRSRAAWRHPHSHPKIATPELKRADAAMKSVDSFQRKGAKVQSPDTNSTNRREFKCAKGATDISPGLEQRDYSG